MSLSKNNDGCCTERLIEKYFQALQKRPMLTKSVTSATMAALGNLISQIATRGAGDINWRSVVAYALTALLYVGPTMHVFYGWMECAMPRPASTKKGVAGAGPALLRVLLDRFVMAPPWMLAYFYILAQLEGLGHSGAVAKIRETYWTILKTNWRVWTIFQFVNVNYVPAQFRVLFASCLAFFWNIYVAYARR